MIMVTEITQGPTANVTTMPVVESNAEFRDGVCSGYLTYFDEYRVNRLPVLMCITSWHRISWI